MKRDRLIPPRSLARAIETAKSLVKNHCDPALPPGDRLRQLGKELGVTRIEPGALGAAGFLALQGDGTFAIHYANEMPARSRYTVAHELAHIILHRYFKHLSTGRTKPRVTGKLASRRIDSSLTQSHSSAVERAVERIAAELLMPEPLVIQLMRGRCLLERESSPDGAIDKRKVLREVAESLGASQLALLNRLFELTEILAVRHVFQWDTRRLFRRRDCIYDRIAFRASRSLQIESHPNPSRANLEGKDGWELPVRVTTPWGDRTIRCQGWRRIRRANKSGVETAWVVGWTWSTFPMPKWDDSLE